jgi:hypothetical protein
MQLIGDALAVAAFIGSALFVLLFASLAPWWRNVHGRNVMLLMVTITLAFGLATATIVFGVEWPIRPTLRAIIFLFIAIAVWWRVAILIKDQVIARRSRSAEGEEHVNQVR